jgi:hypothetical protein
MIISTIIIIKKITMVFYYFVSLEYNTW